MRRQWSMNRDVSQPRSVACAPKVATPRTRASRAAVQSANVPPAPVPTIQIPLTSSRSARKSTAIR